MGTPIPNKKNEQRGVGAGPVDTFRWSPEKIEEHLSKLGPKKQVEISRPLKLAVKSYKSIEDEVNEMSEVITVTEELTKERYIELKGKGFTDKAIKKKFKMPPNRFYLLKREWGLVGQNITAESVEVGETNKQNDNFLLLKIAELEKQRQELLEEKAELTAENLEMKNNLGLREQCINELKEEINRLSSASTPNLKIERKVISLQESVSISAARAVLEELDVDYTQKYKNGRWEISVEIVCEDESQQKL